jgi:enoyl-CoA hydratase/3-hydroxyacyl-CoA dehydrogenase
MGIYALMTNEAAWLIANEVTTREQIDLGAKVAAGFPEGVFERAERIGYARLLETLEDLHRRHGDACYRAEPLLRRWASEPGK